MFNPLKRTYSAEDRKMFRFLHKNAFFRSMREDELAQFIPYMYLRTYEKGEAIFFRNDPSQAFYIIRKGTVSLNIDIEENFEELTHLNAGESFGENALLQNKFRHYNTICFSDYCELYVVPTTNVLQIFDSNRTIKAKMMTAMAEYYDSYHNRLFRAYKESFGFFDLGLAYRGGNSLT